MMNACGEKGIVMHNASNVVKLAPGLAQPRPRPNADYKGHITLISDKGLFIWEI